MSKKKYKLKGAKPAKNLSFGETPEGVHFFEISDKTGAIRFLINGYIEFYNNGELVFMYDPTLKPEPLHVIQSSDFNINPAFLEQEIFVNRKRQKGGVIK